ncbi:MAG: bifunctional hydroxymethylpyrimidine kinase/phosphomethylpyrimidine kinase [Blastocatellia bacterium]|nr:bifunctional hydroxymethylpyrimidine kinase/phosphomethylpyrimidine kinase [Blastocatellia bacterium]
MLVDIVEKFQGLKVVIIGDLIADEFVFGEIARVSREAPVMILRYEKTETMPGGAGNAAVNVASLAGSAELVAASGREVSARRVLLSLRERGVKTGSVITSSEYSTPTKTRILAGSIHSTRQQVIRIDREPNPELAVKFIDKLVNSLENALEDVDAVIVSDYNYGLIDSLIGKLAQMRASSSKAFPVVVDSRFKLRLCTGFTAATPNQSELEELAGTRLNTLSEIVLAGERLRTDLGLEALLLTRGGEGIVLLEADRTPLVLDAIGSKEPVDVTGAGDTVIAAFTLALAAGANFAEAAQIANHAGGIVVMKRGTAAVTREELVDSIERIGG